MRTVVQTVCGQRDVEQLGMTAMHEHLFIDGTRSQSEEAIARASAAGTWQRGVTIDALGELRVAPASCADNLRLTDVEEIAEEVRHFQAIGGKTIVEPTCRGIGRQHLALRELSERTGLQVVAGTGWYLEASHPPEVRALSVAQLADLLVVEVTEGIDGSDVRAGIIGEIGISSAFSGQEEKALRAAARAQVRTGVPLMVHLPSEGKHGHRVLDVAESEGCSAGAVILCHLNWEVDDSQYQRTLLQRGCWLEWDMLGMDFFYPREGEQAPCDRESLRAIKSLMESGYSNRLLLASDVFLKIMLRRYGGFGYDYVARHIVERLQLLGVPRGLVMAALTENPQKVFEAAAVV